MRGAPRLRTPRRASLAQLFLFPTLRSASRVLSGFAIVLVVVNLSALPILLMLDVVVLCTR